MNKFFVRVVYDSGDSKDLVLDFNDSHDIFIFLDLLHHVSIHSNISEFDVCLYKM